MVACRPFDMYCHGSIPVMRDHRVQTHLSEKAEKASRPCTTKSSVIKDRHGSKGPQKT